MIDYNTLLRDIEEHVQSYFDEHRLDLEYHNKLHTERVVKAAKLLADHYGLSDRDRFIVLASAWFHDLGYYTCREGHEESGAECAGQYLTKKEVEPVLLSEIKACILSTRVPQKPGNLNEQILCDADLYHLGSADFDENNKLMRKEVEQRMGKVSGSEWRMSTIAFLISHKYHTDYARERLEPQKLLNLQKLKDKEEQKRREKNEVGPFATVTEKEVPRKKGDKPERGIETMFRISSGNHQRLSDMADNKAHILITVNSIILSAIISLLLRKLDDHLYLAIPTFILLTVSVVTIIYSILATRPNIPKGTFSQEELESNRVNLLFFGNFYKMSLEDYADGMWRTMGDKSFLYGSLIRDVYSQGVVLGRKYKLLRSAYNIFMFGLVISVIAFIIASMIRVND